MSVQPLCLEPHQVLRMRARPIEVFAEELKTLVCDLIDTMHAHEGIGLAAPQIGQNLQVLVANPSQKRGQEVVIVNPSLKAVRGELSIVEGCLSVPDVWERVKRGASVHITGRDPTGTPVAIEADGLLAVVLQHEVDHLHGRLFIDRLPWYRRLRVRAPLAHAKL